MKLEKPYLLFLGDAHDELAAKTAIGVLDWCPDDCIGQFKLPGCAPDLNLPTLSMAEAAGQGAKTVLIGVAVRGGVIPDSWSPHLVEALEHNMSIANGLHTTLDSIAAVRQAAQTSKGQLHEIRKPSTEFEVASGIRRSGRRLLTVGTDCSVGKMYTSLALAREMRRRQMDVDFRATGQTGIFIEGSGVPVDAVVADFISGSVEALCPAADEHHWDIIEGQGSLHHPSFAGVSLGLLHGAQPDSLVLCHEPTRTHMRGLPDRQLPSLEEAMIINIENAHSVQEAVQFCGISVNTKHMSETESQRYLASLEDAHQLPCVDPFRFDVGPIVDNLG